jgi:hypothetical protein
MKYIWRRIVVAITCKERGRKGGKEREGRERRGNREVSNRWRKGIKATDHTCKISK